MLFPLESPLTVVIVNTVDNDRHRLAAFAQHAGFHVVALRSGEDALAHLAPTAPTVMVVDRALADMSAMALINELHERGVFLPTVVTVPQLAIEDAVNALKTGAQEVLEAPFGAYQFLHSICNAMKEVRTL